MSQSVYDGNFNTSVLDDDTLGVDINAGRGDGVEFKEKRQRVLMKAAMKTINNPFFVSMMEKDLEEQQKYFEMDPPPVPTEWMKLGEQMVMQEAMGQGQMMENSI